MSKKQKKQNKRKKKKQNQQVQKTKVQHFQTRKEFVTWLIGVFIWYAISIGSIVLGIHEIKNGDDALGEIEVLAGVIFTLAATGIIIGTMASELGAILLGLMLLVPCLILPAVSKFYLIIILTVPMWISGFLIIVDNIAKLTKTTDKKYYKVIFGFANKYFDSLYKRITNKKKNKTQEVVEDVITAASKAYRLLVKIYAMFFVILLAGFGVFCFYKGGVMEGIIMMFCAAFIFIVNK